MIDIHPFVMKIINECLVKYFAHMAYTDRSVVFKSTVCKPLQLVL